MRFILLFFILTVAGSAFAQTSPHGFSFRVGTKAYNDYSLNQLDPALTRIRITDQPAYDVSLRYNFHFSDRLSAYVGYGTSFSATRVSFFAVSDNSVGESFAGGIRSNHTVFQYELGGAYALPVTYRLSFVAELGGQVVDISPGGGSGRRSSTNQDEIFLRSSAYRFEENPEDKLNFALQVAPGLKYQLGDHFYLTLRANLVFSNAKLLENGEVDVTVADLGSTSGTFERPYSSKGIDLMVSYRF